MPAPILTQIEAAMKALIESTTVAGGYNYEWGTVNQPDLARCTYPTAEIILSSEVNLDEVEGAHANAYMNEAEFLIRVTGENAAEDADSPVYAINAIHNLALDDLKKLFGTNYSLSDTADMIMYQGMQRVTSTAGDIFVPGHIETTWMVRYSQDRQTPTTRGDDP